jgi:phage I-like protein
MIEFIEDGMELSQIREILNAVIQKVNQGQTTPLSFYDLSDRPCINGVELSANTTAQELNITLSQLKSLQEIENLVTQLAEQKTTDATRSVLASKLDSNFSALPQLQYNLDEGMSIIINTSQGETFKTNMADLIMYLKHEIIKIDSQYLRVIH